MADDTLAAIAPIAATDPEVRAHISRVMHLALTGAEEILTRGRYEYRIALMRSLLPALARAASTGGESEEMAEARKQFQSLLDSQRTP